MAFDATVIMLARVRNAAFASSTDTIGHCAVCCNSATEGRSIAMAVSAVSVLASFNSAETISPYLLVPSLVSAASA